MPRGVNSLAAVLTMQSIVSAGVSCTCLTLHSSGMTIQQAAALAASWGGAGARRVRLRSRAHAPALRLPALLDAQSLAWSDRRLQGTLLVRLSPCRRRDGMVTLERATLVADRFGLETYGAVNGRIASYALAGRAAAPLVVGAAATATGAYGSPFLMLAGLIGAAAACAERVNAAQRCPDVDPRRTRRG